MFPKSILRAFNGQPILIHGDGRHIRQWTPVSISVKVIADYISGKLPHRDVLHIAQRQELQSNLEIVKLWCNILESDFDIKATYEHVSDRNGNDLMYALNTDRDIDEYFIDHVLHRQFKMVMEFYKNNVKLYNRPESKHLELGAI
jgi:dTDP-D-glucose 4,6-dehydratase